MSKGDAIELLLGAGRPIEVSAEGSEQESNHGHVVEEGELAVGHGHARTDPVKVPRINGTRSLFNQHRHLCQR